MIALSGILKTGANSNIARQRSGANKKAIQLIPATATADKRRATGTDFSQSEKLTTSVGMGVGISSRP